MAAAAYALSSVTLTALVCQRTWQMQLVGNLLTVSFSWYVENCTSVEPWVGHVPQAAFLVLSAWEVLHPLVALRWYGCRWQPGTVFLILRIAEQGPPPAQEGAEATHTYSWFVRSNKALDPDQIRTIKNRFFKGCPEPFFWQSSGRRPQKEYCFRAVRFLTSKQGRLCQRVSEWAPGIPGSKLEYRSTPLQRFDRFLSTYFWTACVMAMLLVAVQVEPGSFFDSWVAAPWHMRYVAVSPILAFVCLVGVLVEAICNLLIKAARIRLPKRLEVIRRRACNAWASTQGAFKAGVKSTGKTSKNAVRTVATGMYKALKWTGRCALCTCRAVSTLGKAAASGMGQLLPGARRAFETAFPVAVRAAKVVLLLALTALAARASFLAIGWLLGSASTVRASVVVRLLPLWDAVPAASLSFRREVSPESVVHAAVTVAAEAVHALAVAEEVALQSIVQVAETVAAVAVHALAVVEEVAQQSIVHVAETVSAEAVHASVVDEVVRGFVFSRSWCLALVAFALAVAAGFACAFVLKCVRVTPEAGPCPRRPKASVADDGKKTKRANASSRVSAASRNAGAQPPAKRGKLRLAEIRERAKRQFLEEKTSEASAGRSACAKVAAAAAASEGSSVRRPQRKSSRAAVPVCTTSSASAPVLRRSPRTRLSAV
jgi:hypothetical protein